MSSSSLDSSMAESDFVPPPPSSEIHLARTYELAKVPVYVPDKTITDPVALEEILNECCGLFQSHKITPLNAFNLKLIECFDEVIKMEGFDQSNMQKVGKALEVGAKIFTCRVEHTANTVLILAESVAEKKKKRGEVIDQDRDKDDSMEEGAGNESDDDMNRTRFELGDEELEFEFLDGGVMIPKNWDNERIVNKNLGSDDQFVMEDTRGVDNGEMRRTTMKEGFDAFALGSKKFDFASAVFSKAHMEEKRRDCVGTKLNQLPFNPLIVNTSAMGLMETLPFLRFAKGKFDVECIDVWGNPLNAVGINKDENLRAKMLEKRRQLRERLSMRREDLIRYSEGHVGEGIGGSEDMDLDDEPGGSQSVHNITPHHLEGVDLEEIAEYLQDDYVPVNVDGELKPLNIRDVSSLDDVDVYYNALKNYKLIKPDIYGWSGPNFVRNRRPIKRGDATKVKKCKQEPVKILEMDWNDPKHRYDPVAYERTEISEEEMQRMADVQPLIPFMDDCNDVDGLEDDLFNDAFEGAFYAGHAPVERLTKYFVDYDRDIFEGIGAERERQRLRREQKAKEAKEKDKDKDQDKESDGDSIGGDDGPHDAGQSFQLGNAEAERSIRQIDEEFNAQLGVNEDAISEGDLDIFRRHKMLPEKGSTGFNFGSEAEEYALSRFSDAESLKYARRPKPINIVKVKDCITKILKQRLELDRDGKPTQDGETSIDMLTLMTEMLQMLDENTIRYLSIAITLVATLHVTVDMKLFMDSGVLGSVDNPLIISKGKLWKHADHIPGYPAGSQRQRPVHVHDPDSEEDLVVSQPKKMRARKNLEQRRLDDALEDLMETSEDANDEDFVDASED